MKPGTLTTGWWRMVHMRLKDFSGQVSLAHIRSDSVALTASPVKRDGSSSTGATSVMLGVIRAV